MSRAELAARQAELVAALVTGGRAPEGVDAGRLAVARRALLRKRAGEVAAAWPLLAAAGALAPLGLEELAAREVTWRYDGRTTPKRRHLTALRRIPGGFVIQLTGRVLHFRPNGTFW